MGANFNQTTGLGKTAAEAFEDARREADAEYGHQQGYSGALNSGGGSFVLIPRKPGLKANAVISLILDIEDDFYAVANVADETRWARTAAEKRKVASRAKRAEATIARTCKRLGYTRDQLERYTETMSDKWGGSLAVELGGKEATYAKRGRRGVKAYTFFGYYPS